MSLDRSRPAPAFADHREAIRAALHEVAERSFFAFWAPSDAGQFAELAAHPPVFDPGERPPAFPWLVTRVAFAGAFAGHVELAVGEPLARQLLDAFVGLEPDAPVTQPMIQDVCGEFCNQVCGAWLSRACRDWRFDLVPPVVTRHAPGPLPPLDAPGPGEGELFLTLNDLPIRLRLHFEPGLS